MYFLLRLVIFQPAIRQFTRGYFAFRICWTVNRFCPKNPGKGEWLSWRSGSFGGWMPERSGGKSPNLHRLRGLDFRENQSGKTPKKPGISSCLITEKVLISYVFFAGFFGQAGKNPRISWWFVCFTKNLPGFLHWGNPWFFLPFVQASSYRFLKHPKNSQSKGFTKIILMIYGSENVNPENINKGEVFWGPKKGVTKTPI